MSLGITVPKEFYDIGYSGLFHITATILDQHIRDEIRSKVPYLVGNTGWMVLEVNSDGDAVLVRRDCDAICDLFFSPRMPKRLI